MAAADAWLLRAQGEQAKHGKAVLGSCRVSVIAIHGRFGAHSQPSHMCVQSCVHTHVHPSSELMPSPQIHLLFIVVVVLVVVVVVVIVLSGCLSKVNPLGIWMSFQAISCTVIRQSMTINIVSKTFCELSSDLGPHITSAVVSALPVKP